MIRTFSFAVAVLVLCSTAVPAAEGYWLSLEADDGTKAGLVYPDFQPNNFSVFWMACPQDGGPTQLILEFPLEGLKRDAEVLVSFVVDSEPLDLIGKAVLDQFQGAIVVQIELDRDHPFFDRLAKADRIVIKAGEIEFPAPVRGAWSAINNFTNLCRAR